MSLFNNRDTRPLLVRDRKSLFNFDNNVFKGRDNNKLNQNVNNFDVFNVEKIISSEPAQTKFLFDSPKRPWETHGRVFEINPLDLGFRNGMLVDIDLLGGLMFGEIED